MCPNGLAWCVLETGLAIIALLFIAGMLGILDWVTDLVKKDKDGAA